MRKRYRVRPSRGQSIFGAVMGSVFVCVGLFFVMPNAGGFGVLWTLMAVAVTVMCVINAVSEKGVATSVIDVEEREQEPPQGVSANQRSTEERLKELQSLYDRQLLTKEEYESQRRDIIHKI